MNNIIFIGKYSLKNGSRSAEANRVFNQTMYLKKFNSVKVFTFSPNKSEYPINVNFHVNEHKKIRDLVLIPFYWFVIINYFIKNRKKKNFLVLESVVEIYSIIPIFFAKILGYKIIHDVVEDFNLTKEKSRNQVLSSYINNFFEKKIKNYCSGLIVISKRLQSKFYYSNIPTTILYNSVEDQDLVVKVGDPIEYVFYYAGTYGSKDGVIDLIESFKKLLSKGYSVHLKLVGKGNGQYFLDCLSKIKNIKEITYFGFIQEDEMIKHIKTSHVLCVTRSNSAFANFGFPYKLAEYLSFGIPVLTTTVSDISILLKDKETAYFCEPDNVNSISETMESIILNYSSAIETGKRGRIFCKQNFSINKIGIEFQKFIDNLK